MSSRSLALGQISAPEWNDLIVNQTSVFGQLVAMCTFRDLRPLGMATLSGSQAIEPAARRLHQDILNSWLNLTLPEQKRDLATYLSRIGADPPALASLVARARELTPEGAGPEQRDLFVHNLAIVYLMLAHEWNSEPATRVQPIAASSIEELAGLPANNVIAA